MFIYLFLLFVFFFCNCFNVYYFSLLLSMVVEVIQLYEYFFLFVFLLFYKIECHELFFFCCFFFLSISLIKTNWCKNKENRVTKQKQKQNIVYYKYYFSLPFFLKIHMYVCIDFLSHLICTHIQHTYKRTI